MNLIFPHLRFDEVADLAEGRLTVQERQARLAHVSTCRDCSEKLSRLERAVEMMRAETMEDAPSYLIAKVSKLIRPNTNVAPSVLKKVLATLKFDSLLQPQAFGVRAAVKSERQLLFSAGANELHLQIKQSEDQWIVSGQVLGPCTGGEIEMKGTEGAAKTLLDDLCEFTLGPVPGGSFTLTVRLRETEFEIPELKLGLIE